MEHDSRLVRRPAEPPAGRGRDVVRGHLGRGVRVYRATAVHAAPAPPTTFQTFGNQTFINTPGRPPTTMQTFGNQTFINTPGRPPVTCNTFGNMTQCR
jgi:hypothetical protein